MAAEEVLTEEQETGQAVENEVERERSSIGFPYGDLDDAVLTAKAVHDVGGSSCDWDQLAAQLGQAATGGGFRQRALTAKTFGIITYAQQKVSLTPLGHKICDSKQEKTARVEAFLKVELYKALFEKFKGGVIPQGKGLEAEMVTLGVAKKQSDKARQVFQRSAALADFFWSGQDRLVMPGKANGDSGVVEPSKDLEKNRRLSGGGGDDGGSGECDPAIKGLIKRLPTPDSDWPLEKQVKWLLALSHAFDVIYPREDDERSLKIEIVKD